MRKTVIIATLIVAAIASPLAKRVTPWFELAEGAAAFFVGGAACTAGGCIALQTKARRGGAFSILLGLIQISAGGLIQAGYIAKRDGEAVSDFEARISEYTKLGFMAHGLMLAAHTEADTVVFDNGDYTLSHSKRGGVARLSLSYHDERRAYDGMEAYYDDEAENKDFDMSSDQVNDAASQIDDQLYDYHGSEEAFCLSVTDTSGTNVLTSNIESTDGSSQPSYSMGDCATFHY